MTAARLEVASEHLDSADATAERSLAASRRLLDLIRKYLTNGSAPC